jgi:hypothetical protein
MVEVEAALAALDGDTAAEVRPMVEHLVGPESERLPLSTVNQLDLQHLLWHELPTRWFTDDYDHHELAWALGDFFAAAGHGRYAELCRADRTHTIIAAWHRDPEEGARLAAAAQRASGVVPPDTEALAFGNVMGGHEARVHAAVAVLLEEAIVAGRLEPGDRRFAAGAARLVEDFLLAPSPVHDGESPACVVRRERAAIWAHQLGTVDFWTGVLRALDDEPVVPADVGLSVAPARALLEAVGDGVALTKAGYLPPALALTLDARFGWSDDYGSTRPRGESDLPPLMFLHGHLEAQRLLSRRGGRLTVSAKGRRCLADDGRLWSALVTPQPRWQTGFETDTLAVMAAVLLDSDALTGEQIGDRMEQVVSRKWRGEDGSGVGDGLWWVRVEWYRLGITLGWWQRRSGRLGLAWTLSSFGRAAAAAAFWSVAGAPMQE